MMEKFIGKKEKWTNKRTDKPYVANSLIHSTTCHTLMIVPNFKILGTVVPEKSLTKKKFTHTHTHPHTNGKSKNYIPPIYFVYRRYKDVLTTLHV